MPILDRERSALLVIDFQRRLMPAIHEGERALANAGRLVDVAAMLGVPVLATEQNPAGLGGTVPELGEATAGAFAKMTFDAGGTAGFADRLPEGRDLVVTGCEAHVCVLQTVLGLREAGRSVYVVADAIGSRAPANKDLALERMRRHGAEIVSTEMVVFEWLRTAAHPRFREAVARIK